MFVDYCNIAIPARDMSCRVDPVALRHWLAQGRAVKRALVSGSINDPSVEAQWAAAGFDVKGATSDKRGNVDEVGLWVSTPPPPLLANHVRKD